MNVLVFLLFCLDIIFFFRKKFNKFDKSQEIKLSGLPDKFLL